MLVSIGTSKGELHFMFLWLALHRHVFFFFGVLTSVLLLLPLIRVVYARKKV